MLSLKFIVQVEHHLKLNYFFYLPNHRSIFKTSFLLLILNKRLQLLIKLKSSFFEINFELIDSKLSFKLNENSRLTGILNLQDMNSM